MEKDPVKVSSLKTIGTMAVNSVGLSGIILYNRWKNSSWFPSISEISI
jgi:hypothetical protein